MNEVFAWLVYRYESSVVMRDAAKEWDIVFRVLFPLGLLPLVLMLWEMPATPLNPIAVLVQQLPAWAPLAAFAATLIGGFAGIYSVLLYWAAKKAKRAWSI